MISTSQNSEKQLRRLAAQRQLYSTAKSVFTAQTILSCPVAVLVSVLASTFPSIKCYAVLWSLIITLGDLFWLTPWQKRLRNKAALIQEAFDCDVLELPWNHIKAGKHVTAELVNEQAEKYQAWANKMPPLTDWYAPVVSELPVYIGRVACQRTNCWWDAEQRRRYAACIIGLVVVAFCAMVCFALYNDSRLEHFILAVLVPLMPALLLGVRQFNDNRDAATRLDSLKDHADQLWRDALAGKSEHEITASSRNLQDEILDNRRKSPFIFDWTFKLLRYKFEGIVNHTIADFVSEAKQQLALK